MYVTDDMLLNLAREYTPTTTFNDGEMFAVEQALMHYQAHARKELAKDPRAPFSGVDEDIERIRMKLYRGMSASQPAASDAETQTDLLPRFIFTALLGLSESVCLDDALTHYQAHCQKEREQGAPSPVWACDEYIESTRKKLPTSSPEYRWYIVRDHTVQAADVGSDRG